MSTFRTRIARLTLASAFALGMGALSVSSALASDTNPDMRSSGETQIIILADDSTDMRASSAEDGSASSTLRWYEDGETDKARTSEDASDPAWYL